MNGQFAKYMVAAALATGTMFGNTTTTVTITSGSGQQPYTATVGGVPGVKIVCDDDYDSYTKGIVYDVQTLADLNAPGSTSYQQTLYGPLLGSQSVATKLYDELAYLTLQFATYTTSSQISAIQGAIWDLFYQVDPTTTLDAGKPPIAIGTGTTTSDVYYWYNAAKTQTTVTPTSAIDKYIEILTPTCPNGTKTTCVAGGPASSQEFILVSTPEPATYALFGLGLILLSLGTYRRRKTNQ
ncbi:MAG TPA: PEP-CTERM sorting domain-containing protein [Bryobacteraceae bacterium]|jgi:hypothetical protein